jgi:hypothetical protein
MRYNGRDKWMQWWFWTMGQSLKFPQHVYNITNLLKNILGISQRILLVCKLEKMWFWYKVCNVHIVSVQVKYLWGWETNWTCNAMLVHLTLLSFIPTVVRMSLTSHYRPACVICLRKAPCFLATPSYCSSVKLVKTDVTKYQLCCMITVSLRQTCYVSIIVMCTDNNGETGPHKRQS